MFALEHGDLLAQSENLETKVVACAEERAQVGEERGHEMYGIVVKNVAVASTQVQQGSTALNKLRPSPLYASS